MSSASTKSKPCDPSWIARLGAAIPGLVPTIVLAFLGAAGSTWFSDRSSTWSAFVSKIDKDADSARAAYGDAADLINARWYALYKMADALQNSTDAAEFGDVRKAYVAVDQVWALRFTKIESDIQFYVDETFPIGVNAEAAQRDIDLIPDMSCSKMDSGEKAHALLGTSSARVVMEIVNNCLGAVKQNLDGAMALKAEAPDKPPSAGPDPKITSAFQELDLVYWTHAALRCIVLEREQALRPVAVQAPYWNKFFGSLPTNIALPADTENCHKTWAAHVAKQVQVSGL
jgi:hypothetical protein